MNFSPTGRDPNTNQEPHEFLLVQEFVAKNQTGKY